MAQRPAQGDTDCETIVIATPFGAPLRIGASLETIVACDFAPRARGTKERPISTALNEATEQLRAYFARRLRRFDLPLAFEGTPLQVAVWSLVSHLEVGELISYGDVARAVGFPGAHRGVAAAMGRSPYDVLIPAHRVIGADGKIKGAGPQSIRRRLLAFEGIHLT